MRRALVAALVLLAACGDDDDGGATEPQAVAGHLIALPDGTVHLCLGPVQESAPPRCGEPFLVVDGLDDPLSIPGTTDVGGWVEGDVTLTGTVSSGRLDLS